MSYSKRLLLISAFAAWANLGIIVFWTVFADGWTDQDKLSLAFSLGAVLVAYFFAYLTTAFGASLLVLLASPVLSRASKPIAVPALILLGGLLGAVFFCWTPAPLLFATCGSLSALFVALFMPSLFSGGRPELNPASF